MNVFSKSMNKIISLHEQFKILSGNTGWECSSCPLSGIEKRPFLGGCLSTITIVISFRNKECVRCREVVRFSEGPLSEVRLYTHVVAKYKNDFCTWLLHVYRPVLVEKSI